MSDSKFLKFQDKSGDGLNDKCDDIIDVVPGKKCPACVPNINYISPNWRLKGATEPWLNEKHCKYQIAVQTSHQTITNIDDIYLEYKAEAIEGLIVGFNKADTETIREEISDGLVNQSYDLNPRPLSYAKLMYSIPFDILANIPNYEEVDEQIEEEEVKEATASIVVEMEADLIQSKLIRLRKAFNLYSRLYRVYNMIEDGKIVFEESNKLYSVKQFDRYGDSGVFPTSTLAKLLTSLDGFLNDKGLNIAGNLTGNLFNDKVTKIEFMFSAKYKLKRVRAWTLGCGGKPFVFKNKRLKPLSNNSSWKDPTAVAYFAQLSKIDQKLQAKEAIPWLEIVTEFTYPKVYETFDFPGDYADGSLSCLGDAVSKGAKAFGADLLDDIFSLGDSIAYQFNKDICSKSVDSFRDKQMKMGLIIDPGNFDVDTGTLKKEKGIAEIALEQSFRQMEDDDQIFVMVCKNIAESFTGVSLGDSDAAVDNIYADGLDRLKLCGLFDLMMELMGCLLGGLSLEASLSSIVKAALRGMNVENLGDFFLGLPPEKQAALEKLVNKELDRDGIKVKHVPPWKKSQPDTSATGTGDIGTMDRNKTVSDEPAPPPPSRTLARRLDGGGENQFGGPDPTVILEAYIVALLDVYSDDLLEVTDMLNRFPGAQMIAKAIIALDCPRPPTMGPNYLGFIRDIDLPWCRSLGDLRLPALSNLFAWIPKLSDLTGVLFDLLKLIIGKIILMIIVKIMIKLCELLGTAICKALETLGSLVGTLGGLLGANSSFRDVIRDAICGESASEEQLDDTIAEMFEKLGVGGAALADKDAVIRFAGDLSSSVTRREMMDAFLGEMSAEMATAAYNLVQYEYPQFAEAFPNKAAISDFMASCGTLIPEEIKQTMRDYIEMLPENDAFPANPTLCATTEQLDKFKEMRCALLEGRATPEQCDVMYDELQGDLKDDLESLATVMQRGFTDPDAIGMPPIVSQPGCDDGMIPFEPEQTQAAVAMSIGSSLSSLKKDYAEDMIGNGGIFGEWGLLNMVLCDTLGQPLTAHWRKSAANPSYVDFVTDGDEPNAETFLLFFSDPSPTVMQKGNFPETVAEHLESSIADLKPSVDLNNDWQNKDSITKTFEELGFTGLFGGVDIDRLSIPDMGYNVSLVSNLGTENMKIVREGRKAKEDLKLEFRDLNKGRTYAHSNDFAYGFDIDTYFYDLSDQSGTKSNIGTPNNPIDSTRIDISNVFNTASPYRADIRTLMSPDEWDAFEESRNSGPRIQVDRLYEFIAIDNTFGELEPGSYPLFSQCFATKSEFNPAAYLLADIIKNNGGTPTSPEKITEHIEKVIARLFTNFKDEISGNKAAFKYGAKYDTLVEEDADYVVQKGQTQSAGGTLYEDAKIKDDKGDIRTIRNSDMIMGVSRDQFRNGNDARVYYLDPATYGGSYTNPAVYIKPIQHEGYLGMVNIMFPEFSPCKPRNTDLVDFGSITKEISDTYNEIPEDQRLQADPACATEVPYNRILNRTAKAGIQGIIRAACRIYASTHYLKTYATFSVFKPDFENVFSTIYPQYIVENMERSFKDAQGSVWEFFNTFKDDEFWYGFLEQSVQTYGRLIDAGTIVNPPEAVLQALFRINDAQEKYRYPRITERRNDVKRGNIIDETSAPYLWPFKNRGLRMYRDEKNFEAIQATEEDAKIILKEFVMQELKFLSEKFLTNMAAAGIEPKINDLFYYILSNMTQGGETLDLDKKIIEEPVGLPTTGEQHYTSGSELAQPDGTVYIGYYHTMKDEDNNVIYMSGEFHTDSEHETLAPFANKLIVPIGDVDELNSKIYTASEARPFVIEKYIALNGIAMSPSSAIAKIKENDSSINISEAYPGDLELVYPIGQDGTPNKTLPPVGIKGSLGAKYGLRFSAYIDDSKYTLATTEMDMLDLKIGEAAPIEADSKLLLCLINQLRDKPEMQYVLNGVYSAKKVPAILAIYNDMGFLPSIGEKTVNDGDTKPTIFSFSTPPTFDTKPGIKVSFPNAPEDWSADYSNSNGKWASYSDRQIFTPFNLDWDDWDQTLLKSSKSRIKKLFKQHYYNRDFDPTNINGGSTDFAALAVKNLKATLQPATGKRILPWFKRRKLRDNPFNARGELCKKSEN